MEDIKECIEEHEGQKKCSKCGEWKDLGEFHKNRKNKDGVDCYCKLCRSEYGKQRVYELKEIATKVCPKCNKEKKSSDFNKSSRRSDGLQFWCKECEKEQNSVDYFNNVEKHKERKKQYLTNNPEKRKETCKNYYNNHKDESAEYHQLYYESHHLQYLIKSRIKKAIKNSLPYDSFEILYDYLKPIYEQKVCECCGSELNLIFKKISGPTHNSFSIDQIMPNQGYIIDNVAIICYRCNMIKNCGTSEDHHNIANWMEQKINKLNKVS